MHPIANIRGATSSHLRGRRIVLAVSGSIAAVKTVELARELARHGAEVHAVMSAAATRIIHPDALHFATGNPVITTLSGGVEHVALLGDVPEKADLFLVAPATANTVSKMALGIDDGPVTTCATVAIGTGVPVVVAPAMHEAMLDHPIVAEHATVLRDRLDVTWVEPARDEHKAKLAAIDDIVEAVITRLNRVGGLLSGQRALVVSGSTEEPMDPVRVLTNRSSGRTGRIIAAELRRHGADVTLWEGCTTEPRPGHLDAVTTRFRSHADLQRLADESDVSGFDQVWMPAAINDYAIRESDAKIKSGDPSLTLVLRPLGKIVTTLRDRAPEATLVAFKAESDAERLVVRATERLQRYGAQFIVANHSDAFQSATTTAHLVTRDGSERFTGTKADVFARIVLAVGGAEAAPARQRPAPGPASGARGASPGATLGDEPWFVAGATRDAPGGAPAGAPADAPAGSPKRPLPRATDPLALRPRSRDDA